MTWFPWRRQRHAAQTDRLRQAEKAEEKAMKRLMNAGVAATMAADDASESGDRVADTLRGGETDEGILTAERMLKFLEERHR